MNFCLKIALLSYLTSLVILVNAETPVLIWSPEQSMTHLHVGEGQGVVKTNDFHDNYISSLLKNPKQNAVVFMQDMLHMDHFTKYAEVYSPNSAGGAFKNVKELMEENFSLELPEVISPHLALNQLKESFNGKVLTLKSLKELEALHLPSNDRFMLYINLASLQNANDEEKVIIENDDLIGKVAEYLRNQGVSYTALFTGESSGDQEDAEADVHVTRHILADKTNNSGLFMTAGNGHIYIYLREVSVCVVHSSDQAKPCGLSLNFKPTVDTPKQSTWNNQTANVILSFNQNGTQVTIESVLVEQFDRWVINSTTLSVKSSNPVYSFANADVEAKGVDFVVPLPYSFHCSNLKMNVKSLGVSNMSAFSGTYVDLKGYQLQAFRTKGSMFFNAQDCVGFFNSAIWMGLVAFTLLLIILIGGLMMLLNLSVNDRFDDPKGKTIIVNAAE